MKKNIILILATVICLIFSGCGYIKNQTGNAILNEENRNNGIGSEEINLNLILEIDSGQPYGVELNRKNLISSKLQYYISENIQTEKTVDLSNSKCNLKYKDTLYYPIGSKEVYRYVVNGDESNTVLIDQNGGIHSILFSYTKLNITEKSTPQEVLELLTSELSKTFDISFYQNIRIPKPVENDKGFSVYDYLFYNTKSGYITDYLQVSVSYDGGVFGLKTYSLTNTNFNLDINKDKENQVIELKLKDVYNTGETQYKSYAMHNVPRVVEYENQTYIHYTVSVEFTHNQNGEMSGFITDILVPLSVINNSVSN